MREAELLRTMDIVYRRTEQIASIALEVREELRAGDIDIMQLAVDEGSSDAPIIRLIQNIFQDAVNMRASDVHIEPGEGMLRVRQRIDGVLQEQTIEGRGVASALVTRLKLMSGLDIAEKRLPQDGRFSVKVRDRSIDVRLATMPTQYGESRGTALAGPVEQSHDARAAWHARAHAGALSRADRAAGRHGAGDRPHRSAARPPRCIRR